MEFRFLELLGKVKFIDCCKKLGVKLSACERAPLRVLRESSGSVSGSFHHQYVSGVVNPFTPGPAKTGQLETCYS